MERQKQNLSHATINSCMEMRRLRTCYIQNNMLEELSHINQSLAHAEEEVFGTPFDKNLNVLDRFLNANQLQAQMQSESY